MTGEKTQKVIRSRFYFAYKFEVRALSVLKMGKTGICGMCRISITFKRQRGI